RGAGRSVAVLPDQRESRGHPRRSRGDLAPAAPVPRARQDGPRRARLHRAAGAGPARAAARWCRGGRGQRDPGRPDLRYSRRGSSAVGVAGGRRPAAARRLAARTGRRDAPMTRPVDPGRPAPPPVRLDRRTSILRRGAVVRILGGDPVTLVTPSPEAAALLDGGHGRTRVVGTDSPAGAALARALTDR